MSTVAINGLIGRAELKIFLGGDGLDVVAVNDIADADILAACACTVRTRPWAAGTPASIPTSSADPETPVQAGLRPERTDA
jgi:hypothetical protein